MTLTATPPETAPAPAEADIKSITLEGFTYYLPFADLLPPLDPEEYSALKADIAENGIKVPLTICLKRDRHYDVLDGQHRLNIAVELGLKRKDIRFTTEPSNLTHEQREQIALNLNKNRRQLSREKLQAWALKLRGEGKSYRWIADYLDISTSSVYRAIQSAGVPDETPETDEPASEPTPPMPMTITGRDGKPYPAAFQPTPITEMDLENVFAVIRDEGPIHRNILERRVMEHFTLGSRVLAATLQALLDAKRITRGHDLRYMLPELPTTTRTSTDADRLYTYLAEQGRPVAGTKASAALNFDPDHFVRAVNLLEAAGRITRRRESSTSPTLLTAVKPAPASAEPTPTDELHATFDKDKITLLGRTDEGAWHRAIEVARKLVAAGRWTGRHAPIEFDAYALHDKLFGVNPVDPAALIVDQDFSFGPAPLTRPSFEESARQAAAADQPTADPSPDELETDDDPPARPARLRRSHAHDDR